MKEIKLSIKGPFGLVGKNNLFDSLERDSCGIYFFTIKTKEKYLIEYVGITTRSFKGRFLEHMREMLSGGYRLYDYKKLKENKNFVVWNGRYGKNPGSIVEFLNNYKKYFKIIEKQLKEIQIFYISLKVDKRILERVEGKIYQILKASKDKRINTFIEGVRSAPRFKQEKIIKIDLGKNLFIPEIPEELEV
jgi:hypothetical protein